MTDKYLLYSFDIFDTLITRKVATPTGIFVLMQRILQSDGLYKDIPEDVKINFYRYRTNSELYLRKINKLWHNGCDINFDNIYSYMAESFCLTAEQIERIKKLEIQLEVGSIIPINENIDKIKTLLSNNQRVILISDMYLPEEVIKQMLYKADPILADIKLYLSSKLGFMKSTGELYKYVKKQENVEYKQWTHMGDNKYADYSKAKKLGISTVLYKYINFEEYEKKLLEQDFWSPHVQLVLGCTKNLRLNFSENIVTNLGISLAGALLYPYISWLLKQAQNRGIKRLYFIARDGYVLKEIADVLINNRGLDISTFYLYGSRKAWRLSGLNLNNELLYKQFVSMFKFERKKIYSNLGFSKEEFTKMLPQNLKQFGKAKNGSKIQEYFLHNKEIIEKALEKNKQHKINALKYLQANVDYSDDKFAFIDLDGSGFTQNCLASLFSEFYGEPIKSFYYSVTPLCYEPINLEKYCFTTFNIPNLGHLLELFTRAPHGQTLGYDDKGNAILDIIDTNQLMNWGFEDYINGILEFTKNIDDYSKQYNFVSFESQNIMDFYLNFLFNSPDKMTANVFGRIRHKLSSRENSEYAPPINIIEAIIYLLTKKTKSENIRFSSVRSNLLSRKIIELRLKPKKLKRI